MLIVLSPFTAYEPVTLELTYCPTTPPLTFVPLRPPAPSKRIAPERYLPPHPAGGAWPTTKPYHPERLASVTAGVRDCLPTQARTPPVPGALYVYWISETPLSMTPLKL